MTHLHDPIWPNDSSAVSHSSISEGSNDCSLPSIDAITALTPEFINLIAQQIYKS